MMLLSLCGCSKVSESTSAEESTPAPRMEAPIIPVSEETERPEVTESPKPKEEEEQKWTDEELEAMVLTLAGECYDDKEKDKRLVCEVILNRVSNKHFDDTIIEVITKPHQFDGYWTQSRSVSENDYEIATQTLKDWYEGGCKALSEYLYFESGDNRENEFRKEF